MSVKNQELICERILILLLQPGNCKSTELGVPYFQTLPVSNIQIIKVYRVSSDIHDLSLCRE